MTDNFSYRHPYIPKLIIRHKNPLKFKKKLNFYIVARLGQDANVRKENRKGK